MTGMEHAIEKAADVIANALHDQADVDLFGGYTDTDDLNDSVLDSRYSLIAVARALAEAGLLSADPDLAATLVWLYGRQPRRDGAHRIGGRTIRPAGVYVEMDGYEMRPETAVDLARALLAAAKATTSD